MRKLFLFIGGILQRRGLYIIVSLKFLQRNRNIKESYLDYIRLSTLELVSYEINKKGLKGNVAELGVYKGNFAALINKYFPERSLYLFDTFEGFDKRDIEIEQKQKLSSGEQDFSDTSVNMVLSKMPHASKCIVRKGYFPESAINIDDTFVFVSLDADLYEPIYAGLQFFYPKLAKGGYIFVHDFNNDGYIGARKAVEQFCEEEHINFVPIADGCGTAVVAK